MSLELTSFGEVDVEEMEKELAKLEAEQAAEQLANGTANRDPGKEEGKGLEDGKEANTGLNTPSGGTPLPKKKDDDDEIPPTQPDPDDAMGGTPPALSFEEWRNMQDRYVETPLEVVESPLEDVPALGDTQVPQEPKPELSAPKPPAIPKSALAPEAEAKVNLPSQMPAEALSQGAIDKRLRRIFTPRADGTYLVSSEFVKQYQQKGQDREKLLVMFEKCNYDSDKFVTRCKKITEQIDETELDIGYTFMTEADMEEANFPQWKIDGVKGYCENDATLMRTSKYGGGTMYWVEKEITGHKRNIKRNTLQKMMEWDEDDKIQDLDLSLPGKDALGQAFGQAEAGGTPASGAENAVTKALRSVGYPDIESKVLASSIANKVVSGLQKRILKMEEVLGKIGPSPETTLLQKMREKIIELKTSLEKSMEKISSDYGNGLVNGFNQELEDTMTQEIQSSRKAAGESLLIEPRAKSVLADFAKTKKRQEQPEPAGPENPKKRIKPELTAAGKAKTAPKATTSTPKAKGKAKAKSK